MYIYIYIYIYISGVAKATLDWSGRTVAYMMGSACTYVLKLVCQPLGLQELFCCPCICKATVTGVLADDYQRSESQYQSR